MVYRVRFTTPDDVPQCAALSRDAVVLNSYDKGRRIEKWCEWLQKGYANSAVVVNEAGDVVAFGMSIFISEGLRTQIRHGHEHTEMCIQNALSDRHPMHHSNPVLAPHEVIKAHREKGLHLLGFYGWRTDLSRNQANQVGCLLVQSFLYLHRGLHLKSFTKEVYGNDVQGYLRMGCEVLRGPGSFPSHTRQLQPHIVGADRQQVMETGRFQQYLYDLFRHDAPALKLERSQLELVQLAYLLGLNDKEILKMPEIQPKPKKQNAPGSPKPKTAEALIRQRWSRLYEKLDRDGIQWHRYGRNNQRHDFLQFVEKHREVAFPVLIGRYFYRHPDLAKQFPIPVG